MFFLRFLPTAARKRFWYDLGVILVWFWSHFGSILRQLEEKGQKIDVQKTGSKTGCKKVPKKSCGPRTPTKAGGGGSLKHSSKDHGMDHPMNTPRGLRHGGGCYALVE